MGREIPTVFVKMENDIGYSISSNEDNVIPFVAVCRNKDIYKRQYHRWQLPLEPAFACTTHKMQGTTAHYGVVIEPSEVIPFCRGLDYVGVSRPTEMSKLFLLGQLTERQFEAYEPERRAITMEYRRLRNLHL